ncbi:MAG: hypothetical protein ACREPR_02815, partial [Brasilonema sp.]
VQKYLVPYPINSSTPVLKILAPLPQQKFEICIQSRFRAGEYSLNQSNKYNQHRTYSRLCKHLI